MARQRRAANGGTAAAEPAEMAFRITGDAGGAPQLHVGPPSAEPLRPLDDYRQKVLRAARRGTVYPYELTRLLAGPDGRFEEHDLDEAGALVPVDRPKGKNVAAMVAGVVTTPTRLHPEGITPGGAARRPDQGARRAVRAGVRPGHRGARPGRADGRPGGVVRALGGRADLDGLRHGEHGLDRPAALRADRRVHPRRRRDQRRGGRASTSAPSRTGTPRPRCSCTPRASW